MIDMSELIRFLDYRLNTIQSSSHGSKGTGGVDEILKKIYRNRLQMYLTFGDTFTLNPENLKKVFRIIDINGARVQNLDEATKDVRQYLKYLTNDGKKPLTAELREKINDLAQNAKLELSIPDTDIIENAMKLGAGEEFITNLQNFLKDKTPQLKNVLLREPVLKDVKAQNLKEIISSIPVKAKGGGGALEGGAEVQRISTGTIFDPYLNKMKNPDASNQLDEEIESDPNVTPEVIRITMNDRIMFIAVTFIIRIACLFLVDWMISVGMVTTFKDAFVYYVILYTLMFVFLTFVVSNNEVGIQMLLYYIDVNKNGYARIFLHLLFVAIFLPILYIVKDNALFALVKKTAYEEKQRISQALSGFTFITWMITSLLALRF